MCEPCHSQRIKEAIPVGVTKEVEETRTQNASSHTGLLPMYQTHLGGTAGAVYLDPEPLAIPEHPASGTLAVDVFFHIAGLLPYGAIVQAMDDAGGVAQDRALNVRHDDEPHPDLLPG